MTRTTPPRPLDIEAVFPELARHRGTTTRLHPRAGHPGAEDSSVGGPILWPVDEAWPVCVEPHGRDRGRRLADIRREREVWAAAQERGTGLTDAERDLLDELKRTHRVPGVSETAPVPMIGLAQLYRRHVPDLLPGPDGADLLQVFWCPFEAHGATGYGPHLHLRWRRSAEVGEVLTAPPLPELVGYAGYVPEACVLHPEQVVTYPFAGLLPHELCDRLDAWDEAMEEEAEGAADSSCGCGAVEPVGYQYDLSIPPGWHAGGYASWHRTDPYAVDCGTCAAPMELLLTVDSTEWDGGSASWKPVEDRDLPPHPFARPTEVVVGNHGELNVFACPADPGHPHRWSVQ
ncbi:hypothetical protein [Streptomyces sp. NPDC127100]|uniref:hypothetical protein n=1 Tax=Streptomyces sp. NPDC127100 TaxID=3347138 RepID=UPI00365E8870